MTSLLKFKKLNPKAQAIEIDRVCAMLELVYNAYDDSKLMYFRGLYWKLEKYLTLYCYINAQTLLGASNVSRARTKVHNSQRN